MNAVGTLLLIRLVVTGAKSYSADMTRAV